MTSVELRRVSKVYSGTTAVLDQVDLLVEDGELLVLLGPNGSGKTTLLRLIAGLEHVTAGEVLLGGRVVNDWPPRRRDVAMVFQSGVLYPHLTVEQNLRFGFGNRTEGGVLSWIWSRLTNRVPGQSVPGQSAGAQRAGQRSDKQDRQVLEGRVREMAQLLGIESLLNRLPRQLSGGERQRVALGRALVRQPAAFLLDEPLANADTKLRQELRVAFQRARQRFPGTMILVSHDHTEALALGHRIAVLGHGQVQQIGLAGEVYAAPRNRFVAEFMGRSSMSFVDGEWRQENETDFFVTEFGRLALPPALKNRLAGNAGAVSLGLRMDAVTVCRPGLASETAWSGLVRWVELREGGSAAYVALRRVAEDSVAEDSVAEDSVAEDSNVDERTVLARVSPPEVFGPGDQVRLEVDWSRALWFDRRTGNNLAVPR